MGRAGAHVNRPGVAGVLKRTYPKVMPEAAHPAIGRIERALARIEAAAGKRAFDAEVLERRHAALRQKVEDAIAALDSLIERQQG